MARTKLIAVAILLLALAGCGGGGGGVSSPVSQPQAGGNTPVAGGGGGTVSPDSLILAGLVVDTDGNPVPGAAVKLPGGTTATADASGAFTYSPGNATEVKVSAAKDGYIDAFDTFNTSPSAALDGKISVTITMRRAAATAAEATSAGITRADGSTVDVAPTPVSSGGATVYESVVTIAATDRAVEFTTPAPSAADEPAVSFTIGSPDGSGANAAAVLGQTGQITASIAYGSPLDAEDLDIFPGDFTTQSDTGFGASGEKALVTAGFARISLKDSAGNPITKFAAGSSAAIEMTVPAGIQNPETGIAVKPGDTIPIFVFNEDIGEWVVEHETGGAVKRSTVLQDESGRMYVKFTTTHLSWFNLDWGGPMCSLGNPSRISFVQDDGSPVTGVYVHVQAPGWYQDAGFSGADSFMDLNFAPSTIDWQVWATKDGESSGVKTVNGCGNATVTFSTSPPACGTNNDCDDGNALTVDYCLNPGKSSAYCSNRTCTPVCVSDAQCDDGLPGTLDTCLNANTCNAVCTHNCIPACTNDSQCGDSDPYTTDVCISAGSCSASCAHRAATCSFTADKANYVPGENIVLTFSVSNDTSSPVLCGASSTLVTGQGSSTWNSFQESLYVTIPGNTAPTLMEMQKTVPIDWTGADTSQSSEYSMRPIRADGGSWAASDSISLHFKRPSCSDNTACDDSNPATTDTCLNPGLYDSSCVNAACSPACASGADCDDSNPLTIDVCNSPATCAASCSNTACTPTCSADSACDDSNPLTHDTCSNPGTCASACSFALCTPACTTNANCSDGIPLTFERCVNPNTCDAACKCGLCDSNAECVDGNPYTNDICVNPNTCGSYCDNSPCTPACSNDYDCSDSNLLTSDTCTNPGTCDAACTHTACTLGCSQDSDCADSNPATHDFCDFISDCNANCVNNLPPAVTISASYTPGVVPLLAHFTATCSDPDGTCAPIYSWNFGDGATEWTAAPNSAHMYNTTGNYTVSVSVLDYYYGSAQATAAVQVYRGPVGTITPSPTVGTAPLTVNFTTTCTDDGYCASYLWDFGDGSPGSSLQNPSHTFTSTGNFQVSLTMTDDEGHISTIKTIIRTKYNNIVTTGLQHTCGITPAGALKCWGGNSFRELGNGATGISTTATSVSGMTSGVVEVASGSGFTCALTSSGGVKCWGRNEMGELGDGTTTDRSAPVDVSGLTSGVASISAGYLHTCALTFSGAVKCWGGNGGGQLGDGTTTNRTTPVDVSGLSSGVVEISAGYGYTCAITSAGAVKCWGGNQWGQLGDGTNTTRTTPVDVSGITGGATSISAARYSTLTYSGMMSYFANAHTCAVVSGGVKCWGLNNNWQVSGIAGVNPYYYTPLDVPGLTSGVTSVTTGADFTCALLDTGAVKCWGYNSWINWGSSTPADIPGLGAGVLDLTAFNNHTCALISGGGIKCWGYNFNGQVGNGTQTNSSTPVDVLGF